jgi:hypothetical protein
MDDGQGEMKGHMGSLASWIGANQEEIRTRVSAIHYKMEITTECIQETETAVHFIQSK